MPDVVLPVTIDNLLVAAAMYLGFCAALFVGAKVLPGLRREGFPQPSGATKTYTLNGLALYLLTTAAVIGCALAGLSLTPILAHFWSLLIVASGVSALLGVWLFVDGRRQPDYSPETGSRLPTWLRDAWAGPTLNPTLGGIDLKMWCYQPSLIGWWLVVAAFAFHQHELFGTVTPQMWLYQAFVWSYLFTHYVREDFMLSTWDIIAEHFGFMLVWGDLVYVTFFYSICGWFVMLEPESMGVVPLVALAVLHALGHWVFRSANWQKDRYKRDPTAPIWGKPPEVLGGRLLVSGWWGLGRKINYSGELIVYFTFALTAGFSSWIPYILPLSLVILLTHRAARDDRRCRAKYGELWEAYCARAKFKIVPLLY